MKNVLQLSTVMLSLVLAGMTWYLTLMPFWLTQSGQRDDTIYYSQGMGLWLNFTEHVGDPTFDPGNSLWIPPQESGVDTYASQCVIEHSFCADAVGELYIQYCEVLDVYCGFPMKLLQWMLSLACGCALLIIVWSVLLITTTRRTIVDYYLMHLCIANGVTYLVVAAIWYTCVYLAILDTTFYKDQFNRCTYNSDDRSCWQIDICVYFIIAGAVLYPMLSVCVATQVTSKFRRYQKLLRRLHESATVVDLPPAVVELKSQSINDDKKSSFASTTSVTEVNMSARDPTYSTLAPLKSTDVDVDFDSIEEHKTEVESIGQQKSTKKTTKTTKTIHQQTAV